MGPLIVTRWEAKIRTNCPSPVPLYFHSPSLTFPIMKLRASGFDFKNRNKRKEYEKKTFREENKGKKK